MLTSIIPNALSTHVKQLNGCIYSICCVTCCPSKSSGNQLKVDDMTHYGRCSTHYGRCTTHYGRCTTHYGRCTTHYGRCTTHYGRCTTQPDGCWTSGDYTSLP
ncbi:hypothetical protein DPMN_067774 [Dreissena polymorpha]|uniref:Uncharacterized protein n=1 Tax=Dreissena polymorpha TaxID=45954 RepID=A0A9D3Z0Y0_DREPO|nr:hypothetical protein DPMN_067774 [Dreissena polymorpha]